MNIEIILFGVIALVLVIDFALKGFKKKITQDDFERIGEVHGPLRRKSSDSNWWR